MGILSPNWVTGNAGLSHNEEMIGGTSGRSSPGLGVAALLLVFLTAGPPELCGEEEAAFSRSDWIARQMDRVEFSGGVLPSVEAPLPSSGPLKAASAAVDRRARRPRLVNGDLLVFEGGAQPGTQTEPYIHANPFDPKHLVAGWQENRFTDGGAQSLNVAVSFNGGKSWSESILPGLTLLSGGPWERASDPWVEFGPGNTVYFASLLFNQTSPGNAIGVSRSLDGGVSWTDPVEVFRASLDFNDKEALTVDTFPESRYFGRVYVAWDINVADPSGQNVIAQDLVVARTRKNGSFRAPQSVRRTSTNIGAIPRVGPGGVVYLIWAGRQAGASSLSIFFSRSRSGGRRWSAPRAIATMNLTGVFRLRTGEILPSFAVDRTTGDLYVAWQDARWNGMDQSTLIVSRDGGDTWSPPRLVSGAPADSPAFTTSVAVNDRSEVAVSYYSLENDPGRRFLVDHYLRISSDGGETFGAPIRATRRTFDVRFAAQANGFFLGDYAGLTGAGKHFHLLWISTRRMSIELGTNQPDPWTARSR